MTAEPLDGGTASPTSGSAALQKHAPEVAATFARMVEVRPAGVHDELLEAPAVRAFGDQMRADVSKVDEQLRAGMTRVTGDRLFPVAQMVWIGDVAPRVRSALDALFGASTWTDPRRFPVAHVWEVVEKFTESVAHLPALDATTTELVRLRGARLNGCRISRSRRSVAAIEAGATDATFESVDHYEDSDLPEATKAALALVDAMTRTPDTVPPELVARVREHLTDAEAVEVVLDVARNATNKIAVGLGADAPEVEEGVQLFTVDLDGAVTTV